MAGTTELAPNLDPEAVRIGSTIRALRETAGVTLVGLGAAVGKSHGYLSKIERGQKPAPRSLCIAIAGAIGVELTAIVADDYGIAAKVAR